MIINTAIYYLKKIFKRKRFFPIITSPDDIWLVSFPKSGNTWVSFILGNIMIDYCNKNMEMDFNNLQKIIPDIYVSRNIPASLGFNNFPRIIKTHEEYCKEYKRSIYIIRDPRDVMVSYFHYLQDGCNRNNGNFSEFIRGNKGIISWCRHITSWMNKYNIIISYENLKCNPKKEIKKALKFLNINIEDRKIDEAIKKSTFKNMRKIEKSNSAKWKNIHNINKNFSFVRKGKINQWKKYFNNTDLIFYRKLIKKTGLESFTEKYNYY